MLAKPTHIQLLVVAVMSLVLLLQDHVNIAVDRNSNTTATSAFKFKTVSPPAKDDAATNAKVMLLDGDVDPNGGELGALVDGLVPTTEDQPAANVFCRRIVAKSKDGVHDFPLAAGKLFVRWSWHDPS